MSFSDYVKLTNRAYVDLGQHYRNVKRKGVNATNDDHERGRELVKEYNKLSKGSAPAKDWDTVFPEVFTDWPPKLS